MFGYHYTLSKKARFPRARPQAIFASNICKNGFSARAVPAGEMYTFPAVFLSYDISTVYLLKGLGKAKFNLLRKIVFNP
ncbi:MAG: hypothetical protein K0S34_1446 [Bacillales bacterium]|jgi:hypothetical protein|nr:hypothetical protein [Bacillales bacterium]